MKKELNFYPPLNLDNILRKSPINFLTRYQNPIDWSKYDTNNSDKFLENAKNRVYNDNKKTEFINEFKYSNIYPAYLNTTQENKDKEKLKDSFEIMRKLGFNEKLFHGANDASRCFMYRCVIMHSEIDLFSNIDVVNRAIKEWIRIQPMLRSLIIPVPNQQHAIHPDFNFVNAPDHIAYSLKNIKYLHYKSNCARYCDDIWKLLLEQESTMPMESKDSLGWRLTFLKIKYFNDYNEVSSKKFCYSVILTFDHALMDGRSSYNSLLQLFSIIENMYLFNYVKPTENKILPSKEDMFDARANLTGIVGDDRFLTAPDYMDISNAYKSSYIRVKCLHEEEENFGAIYNYFDNSLYITVKQLNSISQLNCSKFRTLLIKKPDFEKILKKCKENNTKLTSFLNMVLIAAFRLVNLKYDKTCLTSYESIHYTTNISLREFDEFKKCCNNGNETIGCYIGLMTGSFYNSFNFKDSSKWKPDVWKYAKEESKKFHDRLRNKEFVHTLSLPYGNKEANNYLYHFGMSNLGVLESSLTKNKLIQIKQTFASTKYSRESFLCWFTNLIGTIDNELCWTISFNSHVMKQEIITTFIEYITKIIKELIR